MNKKAYPQGEIGVQIRAPHDIQKWMKAMQTIYTQVPTMGWDGAFGTVTANWGVMEQLDFKNWLKFYEEQAHKKYKTAQFAAPTRYLDNGGGIVPIDSLRAALPVRVPDMGEYVAQQHEAEKLRQDQATKHDLLQKKIKALIGRLNAAEKVATLPEVQSALKNALKIPLDQWLSTLQNLKLQVQMAAPSVRIASVEDLIVKHANILISKGDQRAAKILIRVAQGLPTETMMGGPQMNPSTSPMPQQPVAADSKDDPAVSEFLKLLSGDQNDVNDNEDEEEKKEDELAAITVDDTDRVVTAQAAPGMAGPPPPPDPGPDLQVSEEEVAPAAPEVPAAPSPIPASEQHQDPFDVALANVKMPDLIARLEAISSMFKNREIARQLSVVDLVLDKLGLAPFFPTLAEAMRSALESNQYCQSRIEDILSKLRGTVSTPMSNELEGEIGTDNLELEMIKKNLAKEEVAEKDRKERRKAQQLAEEEAALAPEAGVAQAPEELAGPATVQRGPAAPVRPTAG